MLDTKTRFFIIGSGFAGQMIAQDIERKKIFGTVAAFLDDDKNLIGTKIDSIPVLGPIDDALSLVQAGPKDEAIIAMPSVSSSVIRSIYDVLKSCGFSRIKILPSVSQVIEGKDARLVQTREIDPLDILGRTPVTISLKEALSYLRGKRVLITGAGGSIGSELARQLLSGGAQRLYLFGHGENSIYQIDRELRLLQEEGVGEKAVIVPIIGDMKDAAYCKYIFCATKCDVVFHCAAYKHVPLMQENPIAAIENNVFGTKNLIEAALQSQVKRFVLISTDKAVNPVSFYGASKYLCEKLILQASQKANAKQKFMFVRFGNVLGSRGSILPLFMEQLSKGQALTVTHPEAKRYFMTIPEACSLVLKTGGVGENGKAYLLDMGEPIKILDLALQAIRFSGLEPYKDTQIKFIGLRPGERLDEPLWLKEEDPQQTQYQKILQLQNIMPDFDMQKLLDDLHKICFKEDETTYRKTYRNRDALQQVLSAVIPELKSGREYEKD